MKIYLASSWRNEYQATVLADLRALGADVLRLQESCARQQWVRVAAVRPRPQVGSHRRAHAACARSSCRAGGFQVRFRRDDVGGLVLLLPSGMSAHLEAGWFAGANKPVAVLAPEIREPELMYKMFDSTQRGQPLWETPLFATVAEVVAHLRSEGRTRWHRDNYDL